MTMRPPRQLAALLAAAVSIGVLGAEQPALAQSGPSGPTGVSGASGASCPASNPPNELTLNGGTPQTAQLETAFATPLQVTLANTNGCPITTALVGTPITFTAPMSGASARFAASGSTTLVVGADTSGSASAQMLTANDTAGSYTVTASSAYGGVAFSLTNTAAGIPATIAALAPASQRATVGASYAQPLSVRVLDANRAPVGGATVTFSLGSASGDGGMGGSSSASPSASFDDGSTQATETTDADGVATSPRLRANGTGGHLSATASVAHVTEPAHFALENLAANPPTLAALGPSHRQATVGTRYGSRLRVRLRHANGSPVVGATVTFSVGGSAAAGAAASFTGGSARAAETTGADGVATSPRLSANDVAGRLTATATATGVRGMAFFHLRNRAGQPATISAGAGSSQSAAAGARFAIPLAVTVTDAHGNHVPGVRVTFSAPDSGPGGTFAGGGARVTVTTNSSGIAVAPAFTANNTASGYVVTARAPHARAAAFALVNT